MKIGTRRKNKLQYLCISMVCFLFIGSLMFPSLESICAGRTASDNDIPTWYRGDQWTYMIDPLSFSSPNGTFTGTVDNLQETVVGITGDAYEVSITGEITGTITINGMQGTLSGDITGTSYMRVSDLAQETTTLNSQGTIIAYYIPFPYQMNLVMNSTPALEAFDFPVNTGEQWQVSCLSTTTGSFSIAGIFQQSLNASQWINDTVQCDSQEQVSVPAGTFDCYKITRPSTNVWYSSDAGNIVKSSVDQSSENMTVHATLTLQSFSRSAQPITITEDIQPSVTVPGNPVVISGQVHNTETGAPIQNTLVSIEIPSLAMNWTTMTNSSGFYTHTITAPTMIDDTPSGRETGSGGVVVQCASGGLSGYRVETLVTLINTAPTTPSIAGQSQGKPGTAYTYTILSADPENDGLFYFIDWGDNMTSGWLGPYVSNTNLSLNHTFAVKGAYTITAKARDIYGAESGWGSLQVKMPISNEYDHHPILDILERFFEQHPYTFPILCYLLGFVNKV